MLRPVEDVCAIFVKVTGRTLPCYDAHAPLEKSNSSFKSQSWLRIEASPQSFVTLSLPTEKASAAYAAVPAPARAPYGSRRARLGTVKLALA